MSQDWWAVTTTCPRSNSSTKSATGLCDPMQRFVPLVCTPPDPAENQSIGRQGVVYLGQNSCVWPSLVREIAHFPFWRYSIWVWGAWPRTCWLIPHDCELIPGGRMPKLLSYQIYRCQVMTSVLFAMMREEMFRLRVDESLSSRKIWMEFGGPVQYSQRTISYRFTILVRSIDTCILRTKQSGHRKRS